MKYIVPTDSQLVVYIHVVIYEHVPSTRRSLAKDGMRFSLAFAKAPVLTEELSQVAQITRVSASVRGTRDVVMTKFVLVYLAHWDQHHWCVQLSTILVFLVLNILRSK